MRLDEFDKPQLAITDEVADRLRARIEEHAPGLSGCVAEGCGARPCEIRADAIGRLIIAGRPWQDC